MSSFMHRPQPSTWHRFKSGKSPEEGEKTRSLLRRNSPNVECMEVGFRDTDLESDGLLIGQCAAVKRLKLTGLNQLAVLLGAAPRTDERIVGFELVLRGIAQNRSIEELYLDGYGPPPWTFDDGRVLRAPDTFLILSSFFEHNSNLRRLHIDFRRGPMFPEGHTQLVSAIERCSSLADFQLRCWPQDGADFGGEIFDALKNGRSNLTKLSLKGCYCGWNGCAELGDLIKNSPLEYLDLSMNDINDQGAALLGEVLGGKTLLKTLIFCPMQGEDVEGTMPVAGWKALFACLKSPDCALEELQLPWYQTDESALSLADALVGNASLTKLFFGGNHLSLDGWRSFWAKLFEGPNSLELVDFTSCGLIGEGVVDVALARGNVDGAAIETAGALANALQTSVQNLIFDKKNLSAVLSSNHTLSQLLLGEQPPPGMLAIDATMMEVSSQMSEDLFSLLEMNGNADKAAVVRQKILLYYNTCSPNIEDDVLLMRELRKDTTDLDWSTVTDIRWNKVMPFVMAWAGRSGSGTTLLYRLIRRVPTLFHSVGTSSSTEKRKAKCLCFW